MRLIDISSNNHGSQSLNMEAVKAAGFTGVYIKMGEGTGSPMYLNPFAAADYAAAVAASLDVGFYWFYNQKYSVAAQAAMFKAQLAKYKCTLIPMFDYEVGIPTVNIRDQFLSAVPYCGQYCDQDFYHTLGYVVGTWLAIPGWNGASTPADMVQTGQTAVPGIPNGITDVNDLLVPRNILVQTGAIVSENPDPLDLPLTSAGGRNLNAPAVGMALTTTRKGYWIAFADGGVDSFGDAVFHGSMGSVQLNRPIVGIASGDDAGYILVAEDGGCFAFGDQAFEGTA
jgi:hypothetical protein